METVPKISEDYEQNSPEANAGGACGALTHQSSAPPTNAACPANVINVEKSWEIQSNDSSAVIGIKSAFLKLRLACTVKHAIKGRFRICISLLASYKDLSITLCNYLKTQSAVTDVHVNHYCGSFTIYYDKDKPVKDKIMAAISSMTVSDIVDLKTQLVQLKKDDKEISLSYFRWASVAMGLSLSLGGIPVLALAIVYPMLMYIAVPVYRRTYKCIKNEHRLNVDFLDAAALTVGMLTGDVMNASAMVWLIHLGDYIRDLTEATSHKTIRKLLDFQENYAWVVRGDVEQKVRVKDIEVGEVVSLNVGNLIPVDGQIIEGEIIVDQQVLTGESFPVHKEVGDTVLAATVIKDGKAYVRVAKTGDNTKVAQVVKMVEDAPIYETKIQNHAEKFADRIVMPSLVTTSLIFASTLNLHHLAALLTVDFGTGVRVSAPTAVLSCMISATSHGILIKGGSYLEKLYKSDTIIFDKTGTLTTGEIKVEDVIGFNGYMQDEIISYAAAAELQMTHPIAEAVVRYAEDKQIELKIRDAVQYCVGRGVDASINGKNVLVGSLRLLNENSISIDDEIITVTDTLISDGKAALYISIDGNLAGIISFRDQIRKEAKEMIDELHRVGVTNVIMLTGDVKKVAYPVAKMLGIDRCIAEVLPEQKAEVVIDLKSKGHVVAFVGDGINDSVALSYADIGFSVKGGADITKETAGVILLDDNLHKIPKAFEISKETIKLIKENYAITGGLNVVAYALAAFNLISPVLTTLISNGSAIIACINGMKPIIRMKLNGHK
ncbi:MAG: heavy metal translocating P-type ATPase [Candidatus Magnetominusculus sp. LBB02]|nr:heavy metal translocating P-type ATPase [Candidatus Magnetominusculus sp. LBB02]